MAEGTCPGRRLKRIGLPGDGQSVDLLHARYSLRKIRVESPYANRILHPNSDVQDSTPCPCEKPEWTRKGHIMWYAFATSRLGRIAVAGTDNGISAVRIGDDDEQLRNELNAMFLRTDLHEIEIHQNKYIDEVVKAVDTPTVQSHLPMDINGTTFQKRVWAALCDVPAGETATYTELAAKIGAPEAVRAVANACGANPVAVLIPCHRAVRSDGGLGGYRWGIERKKRLLEIEANQQ